MMKTVIIGSETSHLTRGLILDPQGSAKLGNGFETNLTEMDIVAQTAASSAESGSLNVLMFCIDKPHEVIKFSRRVERIDEDKKRMDGLLQDAIVISDSGETQCARVRIPSGIANEVAKRIVDGKTSGDLGFVGDSYAVSQENVQNFRRLNNLK